VLSKCAIAIEEWKKGYIGPIPTSEAVLRLREEKMMRLRLIAPTDF
jgi:hypothetical protein